MNNKNDKSLKLFLIVISMTGLALGLSDSVFANYFKDAYNVDAFQRGIIEFPRELPGMLSVFVISALAGVGDIRLSILAQILSTIGLVVLGFFTPQFGVMLVFLFINSLGMHMFMPLYDSLSMSLANKGSFGTAMGKFNGVRTAFSMLAGIIVFIGFRTGVFSFTAQIKYIFLVAAFITVVVIICLVQMQRLNGEKPITKKATLVFRKEYKLYYALAILFGARKQIMFVYGPWVLIELMGFGADAMSLLMIAGAGIGIFFMPAVGKWIDRYGTARIMMIEALFFSIIYIVYGFLSSGLSSGRIQAVGVVIFLAFVINMADRMTMQFGMVRAVYMRSIALKPEDVTPTLSTGMALDHVLSILGAFLCGFIWREWGPQYVFILATLLCGANFLVALRIKEKTRCDL